MVEIQYVCTLNSSIREPQTPSRNASNASEYKVLNTTLFFPTLSTLLNDLLPLGVNLFVVDVPRRVALLPLGLRLHADCRGTTTADLLLGVFPRRGAVVNFVSGG